MTVVSHIMSGFALFNPTYPAIDTQTFTWNDNSTTTNRAHVMGPFSVSASVAISTSIPSFNFGKTTDMLTVDSGLGPLTVTVVQSINGGTLGAAPFTGEFKVTAPDGSSLTATVTNDGATTSAILAVDMNSDGAVDGTISAPWDALD